MGLVPMSRGLQRKREWTLMILAVVEDATQEVCKVEAFVHFCIVKVSAHGIATSGLRQAPPQRVLFQPDVSSSRQTRHPSSHLQSPQPSAAPVSNSYVYNPSSNPNSMHFSIANYEPRPQMPLTLRPILTPGNNPDRFKDQIRRMREEAAKKLGARPSNYIGMMLPGSK